MNTFIFRSFICLCLTAALFRQSSFGQCMLYELPLKDRFHNSQAVIEGSITSSDVFRNPKNAMIYTAYRVSVLKAYKTSGIAPKFAEVIVEGGIIGNEAVTVSYSPSLAVGMTAVFFLTSSPDQTSQNNQLADRFGLYGASQGIIALIANQAHDVFHHYTQNEIESQLIRLSGKNPIEISHTKPSDSTKLRIDKSDKTLAANITSINPGIITAGTFSVLTINGSGFGNSYSGSARVAFLNADNGGATTINAPANHIVSWSDGQIQVRVPTGAGTGTVRVTGVDGTQSTSSQTLTVYYSLINAVNGSTYSPSYLASQGGYYQIQFNTSFFNNQPAANAFRRALTTWRCATYVNIETAYSPTSTACHDGTDGVCLVAFATPGCSFPDGALAATYNYWTTCNGTNWHIREFDMIFADPAPYGGWNFGPGATSNSKFDLESVALHELGHESQLGHIIDASQIMHWSISANTDKRTLSQGDIDGGRDVVARSSATRPCNPMPMVPLTSDNCQLPIAPDAAFIAAPIVGCAPLTVQFTDQSSNSPTSWQWDINNDGTVDYTIKNPAHTFVNSGVYSVKMTAANIAGSSSITKTNYITIYPKPKANAGADFSACHGSSAQIGATPSASGGTPEYGYAWSGSGAAFLNSSSIPNPTITLNFTGSVQCILTVTDANFCSGLDTVIVIAYSQLFASAGANKQICKGNSVTLGASPTASGGRSPFVYSWSPGATLNDSTLPSPIAKPAETTFYILSVRDANNCIVRDTVLVTVFPSLSVNAGRDTTVCAGVPHLIGGSPTVAGGSPPFQFLWQPAMGLSSATTANPIATPTTTTSYALTVTDANNCQWFDTVKLIVLPSPSTTIRASKQPTICDGDTITLDAGAGFTSYRWSTGEISQTIKVWQTGTYSVEVANAAGCKANANNPISVVVHAKPNTTINGPLSVCAGTLANYFAMPETGAVYEWTVIGGSIQTGQGFSQISVKWTGNSGIVQIRKSFPATGCTSVNTVNITISASLKPTIAAAKTAACEGDSLLLEAPYGYNSYQWSNGAFGRAIIVKTSGYYTVSVSDNNGCSGTSAPAVITFYPPPSRPLINRRNDTLFSTSAAIYQWKYERAVVQGENHQFIHLTKIGSYSVTVWDAYGCTAESSEYTVGSLTGIAENYQDGLYVFPNPFDDAGFTIELQTSQSNKEAVFEVQSAAGIQVAKGNITDAKTAVNISNIAPGAYILIIKQGQEIYYRKLMRI